MRMVRLVVLVLLLFYPFVTLVVLLDMDLSNKEFVLILIVLSLGFARRGVNLLSKGLRPKTRPQIIISK
jgi:hypothetical protein